MGAVLWTLTEEEEAQLALLRRSFEARVETVRRVIMSTPTMDMPHFILHYYRPGAFAGELVTPSYPLTRAADLERDLRQRGFSVRLEEVHAKPIAPAEPGPDDNPQVAALNERADRHNARVLG